MVNKEERWVVEHSGFLSNITDGIFRTKKSAENYLIKNGAEIAWVNGEKIFIKTFKNTNYKKNIFENKERVIVFNVIKQISTIKVVWENE